MMVCTEERLRRELESVRQELAQTRSELCDVREQLSTSQALLERERAFFHSVFEGLGEGLLLTDLNDRIEYVNERMTQICGFSREEMLGHPAYEVLLPKNEWPTLHGRNERRAQGHSDVYEAKLLHKSEGWFWSLVHATPLRDANGEVVGTIGAQIDITQRKKDELALRESEGRLRGVVEHAVDGFIVHDFDGNLLEVNAQICDSLGYSYNELLEMNVRDFEINFQEGEVARKWAELHTGKPATVDGCQRRKDGSSFPVEVRLGSVEWNGEPAILALVRDVSERHRRAEARRGLEARFQAVVGAASDAIILADEHGHIALWSKGAERTFGWNEEEALQHNVTRIMPERFRAMHSAGMARVSEGGEFHLGGKVLNLVGLHRDGYEFPIELTLGVWRDGGRTFYASVIRDTSERERLERELRDALWERRLIMEAVPDVLFRLDLTGRLVAWNRELARVTGQTPQILQDRPAIDFFAPPHHGPIMDAIVRSLQGEQVEVEAPLLHADGHGTPFSFSAVPLRDEEGVLLGLVGTGRDISERLKAQEQTALTLREKEVLLKEIHHRVKNNLQIISSLLSMQGDTLGDKRIKAAFAESQNRIRAMAFIHETLYMAGDLGRIDVHAYCKRLTSALLRGYGETTPGVRLQLDIAEGLFLSLDEAVPCGLIINELVTNSFKYGFPEKRGGSISIGVTRDDNSKWTLFVSDDGVGMPELDLDAVSSTGLQLVTGLCDQLEASYQIDRSTGTQWTISFTTT